MESAVSVAAVGAWAAEDIFPIVIFSSVERVAISMGAAGSGTEAVKSVLALGAVTVFAALVWPSGAVAVSIMVRSCSPGPNPNTMDGSWAVEKAA